MSLLTAAFAIVVTVILGVVAVLTLGAGFEFLYRTRTALLEPTPAAEVDDGLVKVRGTVAADSTLDPAVADGETVMSQIVLSRQEGLAARATGSWEEAKELLRAVPFTVEDGTGAVAVEHEDDPTRNGFGGLGRSATVELDAGAEIPDGIDAAFTDSGPDMETVIDALEAEDDEEAAELADELRRAQTDGGAADVLEETSPLRAGVPQKFEEAFAAPGDEVYVIGKARDGRITNESMTFQVRHEPRSVVELLKGLAGGLALAVVGIAAAYGAVVWLLQTGSELRSVVAFIA